MPKAREIMQEDPPHCRLNTSLKEITLRFAKERLTGLLVTDDDERLAGVITETDLLDQQGQVHLPTMMAIFDVIIPVGEERFENEISRMQAMQAEGLMSHDVVSVGPDADMSEVASLMMDRDVHHVPVLEDGFVQGLITKHDVICALADAL